MEKALGKIEKASRIVHEKGYIINVFMDTFRHRMNRIHVVISKNPKRPFIIDQHFNTADEFLACAHALPVHKETKITKDWGEYGYGS